MMCTDEKDIEELNEIYGPLCWQGYDKDPGGFKKLMWYGIMKEFNCKAASACSKCGRARETAFTHKHFESKKKQWHEDRTPMLRHGSVCSATHNVLGQHGHQDCL